MWTSVTDCCIKIVHQITRRKSVLYACERVKSRAGGAMAAARERSSSSKGGQEDLRHGFPIQVSFPDGETSHHHFNPSLRHNGGPEQEAEVLRGYLKPPENKSISDVDGMSPSRSCSMGVLRTYEEWEGPRGLGAAPGHYQKSYSNASSPHIQHRHSASLEAHSACPPHCSTRGFAPGGSYSSSSSSVPSSSALGGSPRGRKPSFQIQFLSPFLTTREKTAHEGVANELQSNMQQ